MFLHIGADIEISVKNLIGIFDIGVMESSQVNKEFLDVAKEEDFIFLVSGDDIKSIVLVEAGGKNKIYLSPISSATLQKRISLIGRLSIIKG